MAEKDDKREPWQDVVPAEEGAGPLLQRDYWAVLKGCSLTCSEVASLVRDRFLDFPPEPLVVFHRTEGAEGPLEVGERLEVEIRMQGTTAVRVVHVDDNSLTVATTQGHPEAGRITFGAYRNERDDVIFHIRSRARSGTPTHYVGFVTAGDPMQTNTWTDFIDRLAHTVGEGVVGAIHAEMQQIDEEDIADTVNAPTFIAKGD